MVATVERRLRRAPSVTSPRPGTSSGAPATGGASRARSGGPRTSRSRANDLDGAEAALQEAFAVLGETQRERWIANTLAGLAEVALLRGDVDAGVRLLRRSARPLRRARRRSRRRTHRRTAGSACKVTAKTAQSAARYHSVHTPDERNVMTVTSARVLGEATVQELRESIGGEVFVAADDGLRRGEQGVERRSRPAPRARRPLRRRRRRGRPRSASPAATTCRSPSAAAATASPASRPATTGS